MLNRIYVARCFQPVPSRTFVSNAAHGLEAPCYVAFGAFLIRVHCSGVPHRGYGVREKQV